MKNGNAKIEIVFNFIKDGCRIAMVKNKHVKNKAQSTYFEMISDEIDKTLRKANDIRISENEIDLDNINDENLDELLENLLNELRDLKEDIKKKEN